LSDFSKNGNFAVEDEVKVLGNYMTRKQFFVSSSGSHSWIYLYNTEYVSLTWIMNSLDMCGRLTLGKLTKHVQRRQQEKWEKKPYSPSNIRHVIYLLLAGGWVRCQEFGRARYFKLSPLGKKMYKYKKKYDWDTLFKELVKTRHNRLKMSH